MERTIHNWIQTFRGGQFWPLDPKPRELEARDIAHSLSMQCRFGGHCLRFYSVAEHCVLMASKVSPRNKRWALLHDASEAYICDLPKPLKRQLEGYNAIEANIMEIVQHRFSLDPEFPQEVSDADMRILVDERAQNMAPCEHLWGNEHVEPLGVELQYWSPERAEHEWLRALTEAAVVEIRMKDREFLR
jgi:hypothetical protein